MTPGGGKRRPLIRYEEEMGRLMEAECRYQCRRCGAESHDAGEAMRRFCAMCGVFASELEGILTPEAPEHRPHSSNRRPPGVFRLPSAV